MTRVYQTEFSCSLSEIEFLEGKRYRFSTDICKYNIDPNFDLEGPRIMKYLWSNNKIIKFHHLTEPGCKDNNFLAVWAKSRNGHNRTDGIDLHVLNCKTIYHHQTHHVTVDGADGSILEAIPVGDRTDFTQEDKVINILAFKGIVGASDLLSEVNVKYFTSHAPDTKWIGASLTGLGRSRTLLDCRRGRNSKTLETP